MKLTKKEKEPKMPKEPKAPKMPKEKKVKVPKEKKVKAPKEPKMPKLPKEPKAKNAKVAAVIDKIKGINFRKFNIRSIKEGCANIKAGINAKLLNSKPKFFTVLLAFSVVPVVVSIALIALISLGVINSNIENSSEQKLYIVASNLASYCQDNQISFATADKYNDYLDSLEEQHIDMAILLDGCPAVTSIKNDNGYRVRDVDAKLNVKDDADKLLAGGIYENSLVVEDTTYCAYFMPIMSEDKIIGIAMAAEKESFVTGDIKKVIFLVLGAAIILFVVCTAAATVVGKIIEKSFVAANKNVNKLAAGDLSKKVIKTNKIREMNGLSLATAKLQNNLASTIGKVKLMADTLTKRVDEVTMLSKSSNDRAKSITSSMEDLANGSVNMTENVTSINEQMIEIGDSITEIAGNAAHLYETSSSIISTNDTAKESMNLMMENTTNTFNAVAQIGDQINATNESIAEIDTVVDLILSIANQTNLLSLNASIEAARAGEQGKGFQVVAEEIRKLAVQSSEGAEKIRVMSMNISKKSLESVKLAENVQELMKEEQQNVADTKEKYELLNKNLEESIAEIGLITEKTEHLESVKERIIGNIHELSAISQENTAANQEVTANIIQIISDFESVNENCESMNDMAKELDESISFFQLNK